VGAVGEVGVDDCSAELGCRDGLVGVPDALVVGGALVVEDADVVGTVVVGVGRWLVAVCCTVPTSGESFTDDGGGLTCRYTIRTATKKTLSAIVDVRKRPNRAITGRRRWDWRRPSRWGR
jgi:hypothetical protein